MACQNISRSKLFMLIFPVVLGVVIISVSVYLIANKSDGYTNEWTYQCIQGYCQKTRLNVNKRAVSLAVCRLTCDEFATLWPKPTGQMTSVSSIVPVNVTDINVVIKRNKPVATLIRKAIDRFKVNIKIPHVLKETNTTNTHQGLVIVFDLLDYTSTKIIYKQNESYTLSIEPSEEVLYAKITAENFFGARHGLETLSQLIVYNENTETYQIPEKFFVEDSPVYFHRGICLDTSRNYISTDAIKRTIEGMAMSKLNVFHWHITDSNSFPYVSKSVPELSRIGAYSLNEVYTAEDINKIIEYATVRGVKILPELDGPAHVGEGWQDTNFLVCFNKRPWCKFCEQPPCGQLDPTQEPLYDMLELIYQDLVEQFDPDVFHMGGDEVSEQCWASEKNIKDWMTNNSYPLTRDGYMLLWNRFQTKAFHKLKVARGKEIPVVVWSSALTKEPYVDLYLPKNRYIIQVWSKATDDQIGNLLEKGYNIILSNYDALYLSCGFSNWVSDAKNWCPKYIGWQAVYDNSPAKIAGDNRHLVYGSEAVLWSDQVDDSTIDTRLWPRAAALAERLWSEPPHSWRQAEHRMLVHRERLVKMGLLADSMQPVWCLQHQGSCPLDGMLN